MSSSRGKAGFLTPRRPLQLGREAHHRGFAEHTYARRAAQVEWLTKGRLAAGGTG